MKPMKFILNGSARVGKDTFINYVRELLSVNSIDVYAVSSVERVKTAAFALGWDGVKDAVGRKFLSDLKDLSTIAYDAPMKYMTNTFQQVKAGNGQFVMFFMIREPEEIAKFVKEFPDTKTILMYNHNAPLFDNHADKDVVNYKYDWCLPNNRTLDDLKEQAQLLINHYDLVTYVKG